MNRNHGFTFFLLITLVALAGCTLNRPDPSVPPVQPVIGSAESPIVQPISDDLTANGEVFTSTSVLTTPTGIRVVPDQVLVQFKQEMIPELPTARRESGAAGALAVGDASITSDLQTLGITALEPILAAPAQASGNDIAALRSNAGETSGLYIAEFNLDSGRTATDVAAALQSNDMIEFAEPNYVAYATDQPKFAPATFRPNDQFFGFQWNLSAIQMEQAWDISQGNNVTVAILDTGVAYENYDGFQQAPDLAGTRFVPGYDFINNDSHPNDDHGHGTHVAGTVAQTTNNGLGVAGVAYNARVMPVKVLDSQGQGSYGDVIQGISFAVSRGAKVINLSLAGNSSSRALEEAVRNARNRGVIVVSAAGNNNGAVSYPARYDSTIAVGSVKFDQRRSSFSNFGGQIDIVAPGGQNSEDRNNDGQGDGIVQQSFKVGEVNQFRYLYFEGTSMASPHVAGTIALLLSQNPNLTPGQVEQILYTTAKDLGSVGKDDQYGWGLVQAADALRRLSVPATPTPLPPSTPTPPPPGSTPTPTAIPPAPVAGNILRNSDFEANADWEFGQTRRPGQYSTVQKRSGTRSVQLGIISQPQDTFSFSSVKQKVTIPANANKAILRLHIYPQTDLPPTYKPYHYQDLQVISVLNQYGREIVRLHNELSNSRTWEEKAYDLTKFRGQTIYVYVGVVNRAGDGSVTSMYVDDVTLVVE